MADETTLGLEILLLILAIIWLALWVMTLIHQAKRRRYIWLAVTALIQLSLIIYWIVFAVSPSFRQKPSIKG